MFKIRPVFGTVRTEWRTTFGRKSIWFGWAFDFSDFVLFWVVILYIRFRSGYSTCQYTPPCLSIQICFFRPNYSPPKYTWSPDFQIWKENKFPTTAFYLYFFRSRTAFGVFGNLFSWNWSCDSYLHYECSLASYSTVRLLIRRVLFGCIV